MYTGEIVVLVVGTIAVLLVPVLVLVAIDVAKLDKPRAAGRR